jgi:hypothetical protein
MIADQLAPSAGDVGALVHDAHDRLHFRAFRGVVQELARLVSQLEDSRGENSSQMLTPGAAELLRQLAGRRHRTPSPAQMRALADAGLVELAPSADDFASPQVRLTVTGEFQLLLIDLPGLVRMARGSATLSLDQLETTAGVLRSLRSAMGRRG